MTARPSRNAAAPCSTDEVVAAVAARFPGREHEVDDLAEQLRCGNTKRSEVCLVHGPSATGKTAVVR